MHEPQEPTTDKLGGEEHPAFGSISAHRIRTNPPSTLFDSEIQHGQIIRVTVGRMTRGRDLKRDWLHSNSRAQLIEVDMSEAQWASFVSSMNTSAVPCTIRTTETNHDVPGLHHRPRLGLSVDETHSAAEEAFGRIKEAMDALEALGSGAGIKARREAMRSLRAAIDNAPKNVKFASESLVEHSENVVAKARADIEAMVVTKAHQLGITTGDLGSPPEIDGGFREGNRTEGVVRSASSDGGVPSVMQAESLADLIDLAERIVTEIDSCTCPDESHQNAMHDLAVDVAMLLPRVRALSSLHENEGGRRLHLHEAEAKVERYERNGCYPRPSGASTSIAQPKAAGK